MSSQLNITLGDSNDCEALINATRRDASKEAVEEAEPIVELETVAESAVAKTAYISEAQLAANRANAKLSTGPSTPAGRAISSRNNFRHGLTHVEGDLVLIENESPEEYSRNLAEFQAEWQPETAPERDFVERLASRQWLRRRALRLQKYFIHPPTVKFTISTSSASTAVTKTSSSAPTTKPCQTS